MSFAQSKVRMKNCEHTNASDCTVNWKPFDQEELSCNGCSSEPGIALMGEQEMGRVEV